MQGRNPPGLGWPIWPCGCVYSLQAQCKSLTCLFASSYTKTPGLRTRTGGNLWANAAGKKRLKLGSNINIRVHLTSPWNGPN